LPAIPAGFARRIERHVRRIGPGMTSLVPAADDGSLDVGTYRIALLDPDGGTLTEVDWIVEPRTRPTVIDLVPIEPALRSSAVRIPAGEVEIGPGKSEPYAEFFVLRDWSWEAPQNTAIADAEGEGSSEQQTMLALAPGKHNPSPRRAADLARTTGARLPTTVEVLAILANIERGLVDLPRFSPDVGGEYCGSDGDPHEVPVVRYKNDREPRSILPIKIDGRFISTRLAFRLVVSGPTAR
jgi:hypothetical protein